MDRCHDQPRASAAVGDRQGHVRRHPALRVRAGLSRPGARPLSPGGLQRRHLPRWRCQRAHESGLRARGAGGRTRLALPRRKQLLSGARQRPRQERAGVQGGERPPRSSHGRRPPRDPHQRLEHPQGLRARQSLPGLHGPPPHSPRLGQHLHERRQSWPLDRGRLRHVLRRFPRQPQVRPWHKAPPCASERSSDVFFYSNLKLISILASTGTGTPSFSPGLNFHCWIAITAFSSKPSPSPFTTSMFFARPSTSTTTLSSTVPEYLAARSSSEYSGSILYNSDGALTPPPTLKTDETAASFDAIALMRRLRIPLACASIGPASTARSCLLRNCA